MPATPEHTRGSDPQPAGASRTDRASFADRWMRAVDVASAGAVFILAIEGETVTWAGRRFAELTGHEPERLLGATDALRRLIPESDIADFRALLARAREGPLDVTHTLEHRVFKGPDLRWVETRASPFAAGPDGRVSEVLLIATDITARRQAEVAISHSDGRQRVAVEAAGLGVFEWDIARDEATWENPRMYEIFGRDRGAGPLHREEFLRDYLHPDDRPLLARALSEGLNRGSVLHLACRIRLPGGVRRWITIDGIVEDGASPRLVGVVNDITESRLLQEDLDRFFELTPDLLGIASIRDGRWRRANPALCRTLGYSEEEMRSIPFLEMVHPADRERSEAATAGLADGRPLSGFEHRVLCKNGTHRWVSWETAPYPEEGLLYCAGRDVTERRATEQALRRSEERFRNLADAMPQLVWIAGSDGQVEYYNSRAVDYAGIKQRADGMWDWHGGVHPDDLEATTRAWRRAVRARSPYQIEHRIRRADGGFRWHLSRALPVRTTDGSVRWFGTATDIHDQKCVQEALRESERRFRTLADAAPAMLWVTDTGNHTVYLSRGWCEFTGQSTEQAAGGDWTAPIHPEDREAAGRAFLASAARHEAFEIDYRLRRADGDYRWVLDAGRPLYSASGDFDGYIGSVFDVHDRVVAQRELRESEEKFRTLADNISQLAWMADSEGWIFWYNRRWYDFTGTTPEEVEGWGWRRCHHPDHVERVVEKISRCFAAGEVWEDTFPLRGTDGQYRWFLSRAVPVRDAQGGVVRWFGTNTDITERTRLEDELHRHQTRLQEIVREQTEEIARSHEALRLAERMSAMGTLSAGLGHDMGNILVPMRLWLEELERQDLPESARARVNSLRDSAGYLQTLAAGLRLLSLDPAHEGAAPASTRLGEWWGEVRGLFRATLAEGVHLEGVGLTDAPDAAVPAHALTQAVYNLVQNASETLRDAGGGRIWLEAGAPAAPAESVAIAVRDDGPGMSEEVRVRCVEPFFTTKTRGRGTGLGLAIVHGTAARYGGRLSVRSRPGGGSVFTLTFPRACAVPRATPLAAITVGEPRTRALAAAIAKGMGFETSAADQSPAPQGTAWIIDSSVEDEALRRFTAAGGHAIALGERKAPAGVVVVPRVTPATIRAALAELLTGGAP